MESELILQPMIQYGFAGMSAILLGIVVWLIKRLLGILTQTIEVISQNTNTIKELTKIIGDEVKLLRITHDKLLTRPCLRE